MDIHVHILGRGADAEVDAWAIARVDGCAVTSLGGADQKRISERSPIDEQLSTPAGRLSVARTLHIAADLKSSGGILNRNQRPCEISTPHGSQSFRRILLGRYRQAASAIHVQLEPGLGMREGQRGNCLVRRPCLARRRTKKLPTRGRVEEKATNGNCRSPLSSRGCDALQTSPDHA
jgi:hypothetical protein